jgi:diamine N-acetyltransferase
MIDSMEIPFVNLRAIEPEDLDFLYKVENDIHLWGVGATNVPYSRYTLHDYVANCSDDIYTDKQVRLIIENNNKEVVGMVDVVNFEPQHLRAEVGIVIQKPYRKQGYAKAALNAIINYSLNVLHLHQLYAIADTCNTESIKVFSDTGFKCSVELKDWLLVGHNFHNAVVMQFFL